MLQLIAVFFLFSLTFLVALASDSTIPEHQEVETTNYASSVSNISFSYPKDWDIQDRFINSVPYTRIEKVSARGLENHSSQEGYLKIEILAFSNEGLSLNTWIEKQNQRSQPGQNILERKEIEIDGEKAVYQLEEYTNYNHISQAVFVAKNNKVYIINFSNNRKENRATIDDFLASFHFNP